MKRQHVISAGLEPSQLKRWRGSSPADRFLRRRGAGLRHRGQRVAEALRADLGGDLLQERDEFGGRIAGEQAEKLGVELIRR